MCIHVLFQNISNQISSNTCLAAAHREARKSDPAEQRAFFCHGKLVNLEEDIRPVTFVACNVSRPEIVR